jgi:hypothetical protein
MKTLLVGLAVGAVLGALTLEAADRGTASAAVGGKKVTIEYGRPALKGRPFDELLKQLPEDRVWRAGENQVTTLTTEGPVMIGGKALPAGKYSLYVHLGADGTRSLLVNKDLGIPLVKIWPAAPANLANEPWPRLDGYAKNVASSEVLRVPLRKAATVSPVDVFTVGIKGSTLTLEWGGESWSTEVTPGK